LLATAMVVDRGFVHAAERRADLLATAATCRGWQMMGSEMTQLPDSHRLDLLEAGQPGREVPVRRSSDQVAQELVPGRGGELWAVGTRGRSAGVVVVQAGRQRGPVIVASGPRLEIDPVPAALGSVDQHTGGRPRTRLCGDDGADQRLTSVGPLLGSRLPLSPSWVMKERRASAAPLAVHAAAPG
jgi:hypothetical protein